MSKKIKLILLTIGIIWLGFFRDYLFSNINWIYMNLTVNRPNQALREFHFLLSWTPKEIDLLKWILTFVFTGLFFLFTYLIIKLAFKNKLYNKLVIYSYASITVVALILYFISLAFEKRDEMYGIVRTLMGIVQSFLPLMFLYILFKFFPNTSQTENS